MQFANFHALQSKETIHLEFTVKNIPAIIVTSGHPAIIVTSGHPVVIVTSGHPVVKHMYVFENSKFRHGKWQ